MVFGNVDLALVGDRDAMGVAGEVLQDVLRTGEGRLAIDDPVLGAELIDQILKTYRMPKLPEGSVELELRGPIGALQEVDELSAEDLGEDFDVKQELRWARNPPVPGGGKPTSGR